ncbi:hypothetical protein MMC10_001614 [Thelotrema lepadinum]|nr:hypothetical protein [Thelotrema lepadinum]
MPENQGAWLVATGKPLQVKTAPYTSPGGSEIVIRNHAVAMNPIDYVLRDLGNFPAPWLKNPCILGSDVSGEVVEVGRNVTRFKVGDRVVGQALGGDEKRNTPVEGAFQKYTILLDYMTSAIPASMSYTSASVIPLGASTAACGLFQDDQLGLHRPSATPKSIGKTVLIWGASSSVGCNAVQLAVAAGYDVFATCSPRNFDLVTSLGAARVFDYNSKTVVADLVAAFKDRQTAGALSMGYGSAEACLDVLSKCKGDKVLSMATYPGPKDVPTRFVIPQMAYHYLGGKLSIAVKAKTRGIRTDYIYGTTLAYNGVGKAVYEDFLPQALAQGSYVASPQAEVVGTGLESVNMAIDRLKEGVSAKKIVVRL